MLTGRIFNIQHFSIHDGPGIRTTVFFKGCPLKCIWCHNPESWDRNFELSYNKEKCRGCGACRKVSDLDKRADACLYGALESVGKDYTVDEVLNNIMRDKAFYDSGGGGITLSGGEPMYQFDFAYELLKRSKKLGLHTCIETSGFASGEQFKAIIPYIDIFLYDYKESDAAKHKEFCGADNKLILENLEMLNGMGCNIILRCPLIPEINTRPDHLDSVAEITNKYESIKEINIQPYHPMGISKNINIGKTPVYTNPKFMDKEESKKYVQYVAQRTSKKVTLN